jgi:predicted  nucleic acid-binding Zn-ribbon protein
MTVLWKCITCSTAYEAGLARCPECGSSESEVVEVPKATVGGASNAGEQLEPEAVPEPDAPAQAQPEPDPEVPSAPAAKKRQPRAKAAVKPVNTADPDVAGPDAPEPDGTDTPAAKEE